MNPIQKLLIILSAVLLSVNCGTQPSKAPPSSASAGPSVSHPAQPPEALSRESLPWSVVLLSSCSNKPIDECLGAYHFSVNADGSYLVGPGPQLQTLSGQLDPVEFKVIEDLVHSNHLSLTEGTIAETCSPSISVNTTSDTITFHQQEKEHELVQSSDSKFCFRELTFDKAKTLYSALTTLATKRYPLPFPQSPCTASLTTLQNLYEKVRKCKTDSDCGYVEETFKPIPRELSTFFLVNDCSIVKPLLAANPVLTLKSQNELLEEYRHSITACKNATTPSNCKPSSKIQPTQPAPYCETGSCRSQISIVF